MAGTAPMRRLNTLFPSGVLPSELGWRTPPVGSFDICRWNAKAVKQAAAPACSAVNLHLSASIHELGY